MQTGFPTSPGTIVGKSTAKMLFDVLRHLCSCTQLHQVEGNNRLNLLHIAVQGQMYVHFLTDINNQVKPPRTANPGDIPTYLPNGDAAQWANNKLAWECGKMIFTEENNMNGALIERLLELIPTSYKKDFMRVFLRNPNMHFEGEFSHFMINMVPQTKRIGKRIKR